MTSPTELPDVATNIARAPKEPVGLGVVPPAGARIMLRAGDWFAATWEGSGEVGLCCEVIRKRGNRYECRVLNGAWGLTFNEKGQAKHRESTASIVYLLPKKLTNVADMQDWDRLLAVVEQQLRKYAKAKKPAAPQVP